MSGFTMEDFKDMDDFYPQADTLKIELVFAKKDYKRLAAKIVESGVDVQWTVGTVYKERAK